MTPEERERFYDEEIAPALATLCRRCGEAGLSFLALAEWKPGAMGRTVLFAEDHGEGIALADVAASAKGNVDALLLALMEAAQAQGHSSPYLFRLGVPFDPADGSKSRNETEPRS